MKERINRTYKDIQLYARFAARKLGIPGYQIHQIYLPEQKLIYIPIPKNACSTIKQTLFQLEFGQAFNSDRTRIHTFRNIHYYYKKRTNAFTDVNKLKAATGCRRFAIIRDPLERLVSCYRNRVVDLGDLELNPAALQNMGLPVEPDLNTYVLNLEKYQKANKSIEHHSRPQADFLGDTLHYLDDIYPIEEMEDLQHMLGTYSPNLKMLKLKSGGTHVEIGDLSQKALKFANRFYKKDYQLLKEFYSPVEMDS